VPAKSGSCRKDDLSRGNILTSSAPAMVGDMYGPLMPLADEPLKRVCSKGQGKSVATARGSWAQLPETAAVIITAIPPSIDGVLTSGRTTAFIKEHVLAEEETCLKELHKRSSRIESSPASGPLT
jgi:hypothetical protein